MKTNFSLSVIAMALAIVVSIATQNAAVALITLIPCTALAVISKGLLRRKLKHGDIVLYKPVSGIAGYWVTNATKDSLKRNDTYMVTAVDKQHGWVKVGNGNRWHHPQLFVKVD